MGMSELQSQTIMYWNCSCGKQGDSLEEFIKHHKVPHHFCND